MIGLHSDVFLSYVILSVKYHTVSPKITVVSNQSIYILVQAPYDFLSSRHCLLSRLFRYFFYKCASFSPRHLLYCIFIAQGGFLKHMIHLILIHGYGYSHYNLAILRVVKLPVHIVLQYVIVHWCTRCLIMSTLVHPVLKGEV